MYFMGPRVLVMLFINAVIWYFVIFASLYAIKKNVNLYLASFVLLLLFTLGLVTCPFMLGMGKMALRSFLMLS